MTDVQQRKLAEEQSRDAELEQALQKLEVVGTAREGGADHAAIRRVLDDVSRIFRERTRKVHSGEFAQIVREDPGLVPKVDAMRAEDHAILEELANLESRAGAAPEELATAAVALAVRIRQQEVSVRNWLMESVMRDRGVVD